MKFVFTTEAPRHGEIEEAFHNVGTTVDFRNCNPERRTSACECKSKELQFAFTGNRQLTTGNCSRELPAESCY